MKYKTYPREQDGGRAWTEHNNTFYPIPSLTHPLCQFEVPLKQALPKSRIWVRVVFLGGDVRKDQERSGAVTQEQRGEARDHWRCVEPRPQGTSEDLGGLYARLQVLSHQRDDSPTPISHGLRTIPGIVNSLVF